MPFNFQDTYMCCSVQPDAEGNCNGQGSDCLTHHPGTGIFTCADHPTAVREEAPAEGQWSFFLTVGIIIDL